MIVIVDIDNTLALNNHRFELARKKDGKTDWDIAYDFKNVMNDLPHHPMIDLVQKYNKDGFKIVIFTGRPESVRQPTQLWLKTHNIPYDELYMRTEDDHYIKANLLKGRMFKKYINDDVFCAYDDDDSIIDLWKHLGIHSFKVIGIQ
jgi:hydroxymethylpyrimidine pyrophosphatase-like HAD family hydrolase